MDCPRCRSELYIDKLSGVCERCGFPGPVEEKHDILSYGVYLKTYDKKFKKKILDTQYYKNCHISRRLFDLAACYKFGLEGIQQNEKEAEYWIERAIKMAEKSKTYKGEAQHDLAYRYCKGKMVPFDLEKAKKNYEMAAELGDELSKRNLEDIYKVIDYYPMAEKGDVKAQAYIAKFFKKLFYWSEHRYLNYPANKECYRFAKMAAEQGDNSSLYILGLCYGYGAGVEQDLKKALECFEKSAEQGNADAYLALAIMYEQGYYVDKNQDKSMDCYKKAFELGNRKAGHILSQIFCYDPQINDVDLAIEILDMLEQNGLNGSVLLLVALSLSKDKNGKIRNIDMAKKWLDSASDIAEEFGADDIVKLNNYFKKGGDIEDYLQKNKLDLELLFPPKEIPEEELSRTSMSNYEVHTEIRIEASEKDAIAILEMLEKFEKKYEDIEKTVVEIGDKKLSLDQFDYSDISKYATDENVNMFVFTDGPIDESLEIYDSMFSILVDDSMFRILAASAPEAFFSACTVANSDDSEEKMECVLSNRKLTVIRSTAAENADVEDYLCYLTECIPYDKFIETFKISSDSLPEEYYSDMFFYTDFELDSLYEEIIDILDEEGIDYEDPGKDVFFKMLDGVMDEYDFYESGFDGNHKEKRIYQF